MAVFEEATYRRYTIPTKDLTMADQVDSMSDDELRTKLAEHGFPLMPITASTRKLLGRTLKLVLDNKIKPRTKADNKVKKRQSLAHCSRDFKLADQIDSMSDAELQKELAEYGIKTMPIAAYTRELWKELKLVLDNNSKPRTNADNKVVNRRSLVDFVRGEASNAKVKRGRRGTTGGARQPPAVRKPRSAPLKKGSPAIKLTRTTTTTTTTTTTAIEQ